MICARSHCRQVNDFASPNQPDGTYVCFDCRQAVAGTLPPARGAIGIDAPLPKIQWSPRRVEPGQSLTIDVADLLFRVELKLGNPQAVSIFVEPGVIRRVIAQLERFL